MGGNVILLNIIYQKARLEVITINHIKEIVNDNNFISLFKKQYDEYFKICEECIKLYFKYNRDERTEINNSKKYHTFSSSIIKKMKIPKLALFLSDNSKKVIDEVQAYLDSFSGIDELIKKLAYRLIDNEYKKMDLLNGYL